MFIQVKNLQPDFFHRVVVPTEVVKKIYAKNNIENCDHAEFAFRVGLSRTRHAVDYVSGDYSNKIETPQNYRARVRQISNNTHT